MDRTKRNTGKSGPQTERQPFFRRIVAVKALTREGEDAGPGGLGRTGR